MVWSIGLIASSYSSKPAQASKRSGMCLGRCCHAIYAIARNGLWDDPAEAVTGRCLSRCFFCCCLVSSKALNIELQSILGFSCFFEGP